MSELTVGTLSGLAANDFVIDVASGSKLVQPGSVLQVVSTTKTDAFTTTSPTLENVTGLSATITPSSTDSKVYVVLTIGLVDASALTRVTGSCTRNGTVVGAASGASGFGWSHVPAAEDRGSSVVWSFVDAPSSVGALTYQAQMSRGGGTAFLNRNNSNNLFTVSTITVMEVAG
jgi:cysteine synthase